jgi:hypothetical protein
VNVMRTTKPRINRRALATQAMQAAAATRAKAKLDQARAFVGGRAGTLRAGRVYCSILAIRSTAASEIV